jgi:AraC-like DNA-binding protein
MTTTVGSYAMAIAHTLEASGIDSKRALQAAGISTELSNDPLVRLPTSQLTHLFQTCVEVTHNAYFGLRVAHHIHISNLHALGYALAASSTLMDFCRRLERYFQLISQTASISLSEVDGSMHLRVEHLVPLCGETEDAFMGFLIVTMRLLYKQDFNPLQVSLHRPMPRDGGEPYAKLFRAPVSFAQPDGLLVFAKSDMTHNLSGSCPELAQVNDNIVISYLARMDKNDVITGVKQKIIEYLPDGDCSRDRVASALCMSPTTLQLKLSQRGCNFQQLLDDTRKELACSYLSQAARSVTEITFLLGFSDTSNFTRAFKRWTGVSPTDYRQHP